MRQRDRKRRRKKGCGKRNWDKGSQKVENIYGVKGSRKLNEIQVGSGGGLGRDKTKNQV